MTTKRDTQVELYRVLLRIRRFEEAIVELYPQKEMLTPVHLCIGQEAVAAGVCHQLRRDDYIFSTHRAHGHCIAKGMPLPSIAAELYGRVGGCSGGRGGSMHLADPEHGIPGTTAIVGGSMPLAAGAALSARLRGTDQVAVAFFGDGASEEGTFHESLNFAALHKLPVVFVCENNFYATSSPLTARQPGVSIAGKGAGYGIPGQVIDGNDVLAVSHAAEMALDRARGGLGATLLECRTYRWKGHVGPLCDVELGCRPSQEVEEWRARCPVMYLQRTLLADGALSEAELDIIATEVDAEVSAAFVFAKESAFPEPGSLLDGVE
jgi:pyruvate dehydrogenase E1 component alpha subunit